MTVGITFIPGVLKGCANPLLRGPQGHVTASVRVPKHCTIVTGVEKFKAIKVSYRPSISPRSRRTLTHKTPSCLKLLLSHWAGWTWLPAQAWWPGPWSTESKEGFTVLLRFGLAPLRGTWPAKFEWVGLWPCIPGARSQCPDQGAEPPPAPWDRRHHYNVSTRHGHSVTPPSPLCLWLPRGRTQHPWGLPHSRGSTQRQNPSHLFHLKCWEVCN